MVFYVYLYEKFNNKDVGSLFPLSPGFTDWLTLILGRQGPLSLSSVLGDCTPEPADELTTTKQKEESLESKENFKATPQNTSLGALTAKTIVYNSRLV